MLSKKTVSIILALLIAIWAFYFTNEIEKREGITVKTKSGKVKGIISLSRDGHDFYEWLGIPYAHSPVKDLRFATPKPLESWQGVLDGSEYGARCAQVMLVTGYPLGEENCLFLNVHTPKSEFDKGSRLPVVINIHAGAFVFGASHDFPPDYFMDEPVVYASMNYRLGALGFASTGDKSIRGNMGLKDQALAIKWIKENVEAFGGDPNRITLLGLSAGGTSVHYMALSNTTRGNFHKVVAQSGNALLPWALSSMQKTKRQTTSFARSLNCPTEDSEKLTQCLRRQPLSKLLDASKQDAIDSRLYDPSRDGEMFSPVVEVVDDDEAFLTQSPYDIIVEGKAAKVPIIFGVTKDEALTIASAFYRSKNRILHYIEDHWNECMGPDYELWGLSEEGLDETLKKIRNFYFPPNIAPTWTMDERIAKYTEMMSDAYFFIGTSEAGEAHRKHGPVYLYYLTRYLRIPFGNMGAEMGARFYPAFESFLYVIKATFRYYLTGNHRVYGVGHGVDAAYYFPLFNGYVRIPKTEDEHSSFFHLKDYMFSKDFVKLLVSFATDETNLEFRGTKFLPANKDRPLTYLRLNEESDMIPEPFAHRTEFWRSLNYAQAFSSNSSKFQQKTK